MSKRILEVWMANKKVGRLALRKDGLAAFEYDDEWLKNGFSISPLSLPLEKRVFVPKASNPFSGLFGVFSDSLPDGWGRLLVDRKLKEDGIEPESLTVLQRLAIVGNSGMGSLEYRPSIDLKESFLEKDFDEISQSCKDILADRKTENLDLLFELGGSSGGARPKVNLELNNESWILKFPSSFDRADIGKMEYDYLKCALHCGLTVPEFRLFPSKTTPGYFGVQRFDRKGLQKVHMISVSALLETSHRIPNLDYSQIMKLTRILCNDEEELWRLFRLMCFNVFSHNRDDHSKNFSFLFENGRWKLSPAYDLTWSNSIGGEHATTVHGEGRNPGMKELISIAQEQQLDINKAKSIAEFIRKTVQKELSQYLK